MIDKNARIFVAGHKGLVGSALVRHLEKTGYRNIVARSRSALDLTRQAAVEQFIGETAPEYVIIAAAKVGGILANNTYPAEFIYQNSIIQANLIHAAFQTRVKRLIFLGSSCIYPRACPQPMQEAHLLTGTLEPTNEPYAIAKIAGIKMCQAYNRQYGTRYLALMPTNLYGPNDNFDLLTSHVLPALIHKFHAAKTADTPCRVEVWGTGEPLREFLHVDDLAAACLFLLNLDDARYDRLLEYPVGPLINIGTGAEISIKALALLIREVVGFEGELTFDADKPDGTPRKLLDVSRLRSLGWSPRISLKEGIRQTYDWCLANNVFKVK